MSDPMDSVNEAARLFGRWRLEFIEKGDAARANKYAHWLSTWPPLWYCASPASAASASARFSARWSNRPSA